MRHIEQNDLERNLQEDIGTLLVCFLPKLCLSLFYSNEERDRSPHQRMRGSSPDKRSPDKGYEASRGRDKALRKDNKERTWRERSPLERRGDRPSSRVPSSYRRTQNYSKKVSNGRSQLSEAEKERRRQEMMQSAK